MRAPDGAPPGTASATSWGGRPIARRVADAEPRHHVEVSGVIVTAAMARWWAMDAWVCRLDDGSGVITVVFGGPRPIPGIVPGAHLRVQGTALADNGAIVLWNPTYEFVRPATGQVPPAPH